MLNTEVSESLVPWLHATWWKKRCEPGIKAWRHSQMYLFMQCFLVLSTRRLIFVSGDSVVETPTVLNGISNPVHIKNGKPSVVRPRESTELYVASFNNWKRQEIGVIWGRRGDNCQPRMVTSLFRLYFSSMLTGLSWKSSTSSTMARGWASASSEVAALASSSRLFYLVEWLT